MEMPVKLTNTIFEVSLLVMPPHFDVQLLAQSTGYFAANRMSIIFYRLLLRSRSPPYFLPSDLQFDYRGNLCGLFSSPKPSTSCRRTHGFRKIVSLRKLIWNGKGYNMYLQSLPHTLFVQMEWRKGYSFI
jgi:hypothetical protein